MAISFAKAYIKHFYEIPFYCARSKEDSKVFILNYLCQHELDEQLPELLPRSARCGLGGSTRDRRLALGLGWL